ncbi:MAG: hypothetical protein KJP00_16590, partial [Bacteroidia bacterium]|nr:hypothetical protein [Bacteroidia bacterium]
LFNSILLLVIILVSTQVVSGQQQKVKEDTRAVYLKNGSVLIGVVETYNYGEPVRIRMSDGGAIEIPYDQIESVSRVKKKALRHKGTIKDSPHKPYIFNEEGWHYSGDIGALEGGGNFNGGLHLSINLGAIYHFNKYLGIGLHSGFESYDIGYNQNIIPVYLTIQGYAFSKKISPTYSVGLGYGIALQPEDSNTNSEGGLLFYPKIGLRLGGGDSANIHIFSGLKIQDLRVDYEFFEGSEEFLIQERTLKRIIIGIGVIF